MTNSTASTLQIQFWPIDKFVFYTRNPRKNNAAVDRMVASLQEYGLDRKSTRLNSSHRCISYAVFCLKKSRLRLPHAHRVPIRMHGGREDAAQRWRHPLAQSDRRG